MWKNTHANTLAPLAGVALLISLSVPLFAADDIAASRRTALVNAIEKAAPAVVTINVVDIQQDRSVAPLFDDFFGQFGFRSPRLRPRQQAVESLGTGFVFDAQGHILTNYHVLEGADAIASVVLPDGRAIDVELVGSDERTDLAVLHAKTATNLPFIPLGTSSDLMLGEWVIAIGNPFGTMMRDPQPSVSVGVVSAMHRRVSREIGGGERLYQNLIQTDAAINPGNSGGPLVNALGQAVGVNTMIFSESGGSQGIGFAIPVDRVRRVATELIQYGHRRNPWLGFHGEAVEALTPDSQRSMNIRVPSGVIVTELMRGCPAEKAGLLLGDVVVEVNGQAVADPTEIDFINWDLFIGDTVQMKVDRQGKPINLTFEIKELVK